MTPQDRVTAHLALEADEHLADAATWREIALVAIGQLHAAHARERQQAARLAALTAEVRRLRGPAPRKVAA